MKQGIILYWRGKKLKVKLFFTSVKIFHACGPFIQLQNCYIWRRLKMVKVNYSLKQYFLLGAV